MSSYSLKTRSFVSTWFSLIFVILLALYLGFIEFFQDSRIKISTSNLIKSPIQKEFLKNIKNIRYKNRLGQYSIKKEKGQWLLYEPRIIPALEQTITSILNELENVSVQTVHEHEQINIKSFSLDKPVLEIDLITEKQNQLNIKLGIINRINSTTYMTVSGHNIIYQISMPKRSLETLELSDFVDSNVFSSSAQEVKRLTIYHGKNTEPYNVLEFKQDNWLSKRYKTISNERTSIKIQNLLDLKTYMIVDKSNLELEQFINNYLSSPLYRIELITRDGKRITYKVSSLTKAITELKIEKRQFFIMSASNRPYPFLIPKKYLDSFLIRYADLKR